MQALNKCFVLSAVIAGLMLPAKSFASFLDNFEDGDHNGWLSASNGGISLNGVEQHNGSLMADVAHTGTGAPVGRATNENSLSHDFVYSAHDFLSFDMQAVANSASTCCVAIADGKAGVTFTFLNVFNIPLGSAGLYFSTSSSILATNESLIDSAQHHYGTTMANFASLAGLNAASPIASVSLTFRAVGQFVGGGNIFPDANATAKVWFDNVAVSAVPVPGSGIAMFSGVVALAALRRSARKQQIPAAA